MKKINMLPPEFKTWQEFNNRIKHLIPSITVPSTITYKSDGQQFEISIYFMKARLYEELEDKILSLKFDENIPYPISYYNVQVQNLLRP